MSNTDRHKLSITCYTKFELSTCWTGCDQVSQKENKKKDLIKLNVQVVAAELSHIFIKEHGAIFSLFCGTKTQCFFGGPWAHLMTYFVSKLDCYHISKGKLINHGGVCVCALALSAAQIRLQEATNHNHTITQKRKNWTDMFEPEVQNTVILRHIDDLTISRRPEPKNTEKWRHRTKKNCSSIIPDICSSSKHRLDQS